MSLLVIGTLAYDTIETVHEKRDDQLGGSAVYFAVAAAPFARPRLVGVVGNDFEEGHLARLEANGVDCAGVEVAEGDTFRWGGRYEADWNTRETLFTHLNVFEELRPEAARVLPSTANYVFLANGHPVDPDEGVWSRSSGRASSSPTR